VVVDDFDFGDAFACPAEAQTPLPVNPDAVLIRPIAVQWLKPIARR
jgi:hypothetical protein